MGVPHTRRIIGARSSPSERGEYFKPNENLQTILTFYERTGADDVIKMLWLSSDYWRFRTGLEFADGKRAVEETIKERKGMVRSRVNRRQALGRLREVKISTYFQYWASYLNQDLNKLLREVPAEIFIHGSEEFAFIEPLANSTISIPADTWESIKLIANTYDLEGGVFIEHLTQIRDSLNQAVTALGLDPILPAYVPATYEHEEIPF